MNRAKIFLLGSLLAATCAAQDVISPNGNGSSKPIPDPTLLTTQQLLREMSNLKELIESRLLGMDRRIDEKLASLKEIHDEKFASVKGQFEERDIRSKQSSADAATAVGAALQAAKEAVAEQQKSSVLAIDKTEKNTTHQIDQLSELMKATSKAADERISEVKDRLTRLEGRGEGATTQVVQGQASLGVWIGLAGIVVAFVAIIVARNRDITARKPV